MIERISESFSAYSSEKFLITKERTFTYSEAAIISDNIAYSLATEADLNEGDVAVLQMDTGVEFIFFLLALWKIGAIPVPLNPKFTEKENSELISFINPKIIINKDEISIPQGSPEMNSFNDNDNTLRDTAVIIFTSGTSGVPKGVILSFGNLFASYDNGQTVMHFNEFDRWLASLPFFHIGGFQIIIRTLLSGASLIIPVETGDIEAELTAFNPTMLSVVAAQLKRLLDKNFPVSPSLKTVLLGGGFSDDKLVLDAIEKGWPLCKVYGSSETSSYFTFMNCLKEKTYISSSGRPITDNLVEIRDDENNVCPAGEIGTVWLKGKSCSSGYYKNEELTTKKFINGWYNSGDFGWLNEQGYLFLTARRTDLIVSGGENINPYEVEAVLKELESVEDAVVFSEDDKEWGQLVSAAIIIKKDMSWSESHAKDFLKARLSYYKIPKKFYFIKEIPRNELGKINKVYLKRMLLE